MIDWQSGRFVPSADAWQFRDGSVELWVAGNLGTPSSHWLAVAQDVIASLDQHRNQATTYLDAFVDRKRFGSEKPWELELIEVGLSDELAGIRFVLSFRSLGDEYGFWSVAFHRTGMEPPNDVYPVRLQRLQQ